MFRTWPSPCCWDHYHFSVKQGTRHPASPTPFSTSLSRTLKSLGPVCRGPHYPSSLFHRNRNFSQACDRPAEDCISQPPLLSSTGRRGTQILWNLIRPRQNHLLTWKKCHLPRLPAPSFPGKNLKQRADSALFTGCTDDTPRETLGTRRTKEALGRGVAQWSRVSSARASLGFHGQKVGERDNTGHIVGCF